MRRCLQLAKMAFPACMPNPAVGAVLVHENRIISEGYTQAYGGAHAEVQCIEGVKDKSLLPESTLYVSLEPCSHFGKTPPCSDLIIATKIKKVVVGCVDSNSLVAGKGIARLKEQGISVESGILEVECIHMNRRFFTFHEQQRPYIILKWAQTSNGFFAPSNGKQFWITNKYAKQLTHQWRHQEQAILVGSKTAIIDNPKLNVREMKGEHPIRIVLGDVSQHPHLHLLKDGRKTIVYTSENVQKVENNGVDYIYIEDNKNMLISTLQDLYKRNIQSLIVEGGATTLQGFIDANLWDEARVLEGENEILNGKQAPTIHGVLADDFQIGNNICRIIKNKHS